MNPKVWGKYIWLSIHIIALGYPDKPSEQDKKNYKDYYTNLWKVLPCEKCSINYVRHLRELPIDENLTDTMSLFKWTVDLHNIVNKETGKRQLSFEEALEIYTKILQGKDPMFVSVPQGMETVIVKGTYALGFIFCIALVFWFYRHFRRMK